jgi:hypothetical protein
MTDTDRNEIPDLRACGSDDLDLFCAYLGAEDEKAVCLRRAAKANPALEAVFDLVPGKRRPTEDWPLCQNPIRRSPFWVSGGRQGGCVEAEDEEHAIEIARQAGCKGELVAKRLPYPAGPRLGTPHWNEDCGETPSFCYRPTQCQGRTSCPTRPSCTS